MSRNAADISVGSKSLIVSDSRFEYGDLPPSVEKFLRGQADRIRRQCASSIIQIGKALLEAKRHLSHGAFLRWVEGEVGIPCRTAQAYMRAALWTAGKSATVALLPASAIYVLSSNGVPDQFVADVLDRIEAGEQIGAAAIRHALREFLNSKSEKGATTKEVVQRGHNDTPIRDKINGSPIAELAELLAYKLSKPDFVRICEILTSESVLGDPDLAVKLKQEFRTVGEASLRGGRGRACEIHPQNRATAAGSARPQPARRDETATSRHGTVVQRQ
ncbi:MULTISPECIES: DUF3102 domain-containing protein [unclassified Bradyrhizobium]|uniref:DUF3102 domain-containing protein n=1 Tax=unclassified Bradyrhizobium TaxID=2631580 RepID=UPI0028E98B7E|nr:MULTISPECIES: DUF3102 domain-containing protein [unclassified Bradyrhizobium]